MEMNEKTKRILEMRERSPFNRPSHAVTVGIKNFHQKLWDYIAPQERDEEYVDVETVLKNGVPEFQRDNDKWSLAMQVKYVENVMMGFRDEIYLLSYNNTHTDCRILDGLQRTTALLDFQAGKFKIFGDIGYEDVNNNIAMSMTSYTTTLRLFQFNDEIEAVEFYIEMNENITHSEEDIAKAKAYLAKLKNA